MQKIDWGQKLAFLQSSRQQLWNDDYMAFLIQQVWRLDSPQSIVDFGCGYGWLGAKLLPLLPAGSSYTGLDISDTLLEEGRQLFAGAPWPVRFIQADLCAPAPAAGFDMAVCQAFLRHMPNAKTVLGHMIDALRPGGLAVCIEVDRRLENAGFYTDAAGFDAAAQDAALHAAWAAEHAAGGRDARIGIKIPVYMQQLGLQQVGVRLNDFVEFASPVHADYKAHLDKLRIHHAPAADSGLCAQNGDSALLARGLIISYGRKPAQG